MGLVGGAAHLGVDGRGRPEEQQSAVDQVAAEVPQDPAACRGRSALGLEPLERGLEPLDLAESSLRDQPLQREDVGVPAAVLVDAQRYAGCLRLGDDVTGVGRGEGERLVAHDRQVEADGLQGKGSVGVRRGRDGDGRDPVRGQGLEAVVRADGGVLPRELGPARCRRGHHPGEVAGGRAGQQGSVEVPPAEAVADESDPHLLCRHGPIVGRLAGPAGGFGCSAVAARCRGRVVCGDCVAAQGFRVWMTLPRLFEHLYDWMAWWGPVGMSSRRSWRWSVGG